MNEDGVGVIITRTFSELHTEAHRGEVTCQDHTEPGLLPSALTSPCSD